MARTFARIERRRDGESITLLRTPEQHERITKVEAERTAIERRHAAGFIEVDGAWRRDGFSYTAYEADRIIARGWRR